MRLPGKIERRVRMTDSLTYFGTYYPTYCLAYSET